MRGGYNNHFCALSRSVSGVCEIAAREAMKAVLEWRYEPGQLRGRAVPVRLTVVVDFSLH